MGQSSSGLQSSSAPVTPRGKSGKRPPPRPEHPPQIPKQPNYVVPENKVLPNGVSDINDAKKLLRPVSQELTKFHPDFADIFQYDPEIGFEAGDDSSLDTNLNQSAGIDKENLNASAPDSVLSNGIRQDSDGQRTASTTKPGISNVGRANTAPLTNGFVLNGKPAAVGPLGNGHVKSFSTDDILSNKQTSARNDMPASTNLKRSQSMERERPQPPRISRHRRQSSVTTTVPIQSSVIYEDPREHLYNVGRHEPFNNVQPTTTSLPLKSSFDLDYSFNVTYAQLAEYRRQKRVSELEARTGKKMEELEAELAANSTVPKSPFDRNNLGAKSATHSVSTGSSESGVSKSKKKKAPAPPPPVGVLPARDKSPGRFSLDTEPPADYDMEEVSTPRDSRSLQRRNSSASGHVKRPAPQPLAKRNTAPSLQDTGNFVYTTPATTASPPSNAQVPFPAPPPPPPPCTVLKDEKFKVRPLPGQSQLQQSMADAKAQLEALKKLQEMLNAPKPQAIDVSSNEIVDSNQSEDVTKAEKKSDTSQEQVHNEESEDKATTTQEELGAEKGNEPEEIVISNLESSFSSSGSKETGNAPVKRLSSLLQHDIVLAAKARGAKIVKPKPPQSLEKPKDASEMFREELAKAANAREERRKEAANNDSKNSSSSSSSVPSTPQEEKNVVFRSSLLKVVRQMNAEKPADNKMDIENADKDGTNSATKCGKADDDDDESAPSRQGMQSDEAGDESKDESSRVYRSSWTPEDDLDSDDDIMDESFVHSSRNVSTEGFKSSIVPPKVDDLKEDKKKKKKKTSKKYEKRQSLDSALDERNKFESIRKLRKSVHEGMRNALGSISKASGKLLKKPKSQETLDISQVLPDTLDVDDDRTRVSRDLNWELSDSRSGSLRRTTSETYMTPAFINSTEETESSSESGEDVADIDFSSGINDIPPMTKATPAPKEDAKHMKRAGVAYVSSKGQIIVLPEYETVKTDQNGHVIEKTPESESHAPKIFRKKKKKYTYESTVRQTERQRMEEAVAKEIKEKEMQIEMERIRQQEMERDFRRLRDLDTQEKLQRLQTDSLRQQITLLQQQQVRQAHSQLTVHSDLSTPTDNSSGNHNGAFIGGSGPALTDLTSNSSASHYSVSSFPTSVLNQPIPHATLAATTSVDPNTYATHSAPLVGGSTPLVGNPVTLNTGGLPNLTPHELSYLSEYMRMMGVTPPSTQQQWAVLLSTFSVNSPLGFQGFDLHQAPPLQNGYSTVTPGPDLSQIFGGGKSMDGVLGNPSKKQLMSIMSGQQAFQPMDVAAVDPDRRALNRLTSGDGNYSSKAVQIVDPHFTGIPVQPSPPLPNTQYPFQSASTTVHTSNLSINNNNNNNKYAELPKKCPPPTADKPSKDKKNDASGYRNVETQLATSPEARMDYLTSGNATLDGRDLAGTANNPGNTIVTDRKVLSTPTLSPKVYGPIGFRPVSFTGSSS